jgi:hypothetical protein
MKNFTLLNFAMLFVLMLIGSTVMAQPTDWVPMDPGMELLKVERKINVYPNPSAGDVNVSLPQGTGKVMLTVLDVKGRVVFQQAANATDESVISAMNLPDIATGLMILKITNEREVIASKMFLVNNPNSAANKSFGF